MKQFLLRKLMMAAVLLCTTAVSAHRFEVDGIYYDITSFADLRVSVTYRGSSYLEHKNEYSGAVTIPSIVTYDGNTYSVTGIGEQAFRGCSSLTSINIPEGVTSIGEYAFTYCDSLTSITIPESMTSIGSDAFWGCHSLERVTINCANFGSWFSGFSSIKEIVLGESVTSIGYEAFSGCSSLTSINIPESVTSIGEYAFEDCSNLTSINIPEGVTSIGRGTFYGCSSLTSITIPEGVTSIGYEAFRGCSSLTSINIPEGVTSIEWCAFFGCRSLTSITIPESVTGIGELAFNGCSSLTSITIPESVTSIKKEAFWGCDSLIFISLGSNVSSIGASAFSWTNVRELIVKGSVMPPISSSASTLVSITLYSPVPLETTEEFPDAVYRKATLYVPEGSKDSYKVAENWKNFWKIKETDVYADNPIYITVQYADNGYIRQKVTEGTSCAYVIEAAEGWSIHTVTFNNENVTSQLIEGELFITPAIYSDATLCVAFEQEGNNVESTRTNAIKVCGSNNMLCISGTEYGDRIAVYDTAGTLITQQIASSEIVNIAVETGNTYMVKVADKVIKIRL